MLNFLGRLGLIYLPLNRSDAKLKRRIDAVCPGWSSRLHWKVFRKLLAKHPHVRNICMLGVYLGRDIAYMGMAMEEMHRDFRIVGVDMFQDVNTDDWPDAKRGMSWKEAGFGDPPNRDRAQNNMDRLGIGSSTEMVQSSMEDFLNTTGTTFDLIYIDVSHDYETTKRAISLARPHLNAGGILVGDDYSNLGKWGVAQAVQELCPKHEVHYGWIWAA